MIKHIKQGIVVLLLLLLCGCNNNENNEPYVVEETGIKADSVAMYDGYGALSYIDTDAGITLKGMIGSDGKMVCDYAYVPYNYYYYDGVISLCDSVNKRFFTVEYDPVNQSASLATQPHYYNGDGTLIHIDRFDNGTIMRNGTMSGFIVDEQGYRRAVLFDSSGNIKVYLPDQYSEIMGVWGNDNIMFADFRCTAYACGEGYCIYYETDESHTTVGSGYLSTETGEVVIDTWNSEHPLMACTAFYNGMACVMDPITSKYGFIDTEGNRIIDCIYDDYGLFNRGYGFASIDGKAGYIDVHGNTIIPFEYDSCYGYGEGLFAVVKDGKCGMVNAQNEIVVPLEYDDISSVANGMAYGIKDHQLVILRFS